ncbi:MAG: PHP domain-containing protein [Deltaproteobacteria bacterium]|nr:PHP domain-containing protein [Deltaproteobacteria bacterium]MBW2256433.1 PHP domain-containing protein [Deltaproteobacteria bacterium]
MFRQYCPGTRYDLHLHTDCSDGRYDQEEVIARCAQAGLEVVALTDHDFATTLDPGRHQVESGTLHVIAGAEVSGAHAGREFHLLVYFPGEVPDGFRDRCRRQSAARAQRYQAALDRLNLPDLAPPDDRARAGTRALTRLHLARALIEAGHVANVPDAFARYLDEALGNVPSVAPPFTEAIRIARSFGAVTSWAHPSARDAAEHAPAFVAAGLQGLEVLRPGMTGRERRALRRLARVHGLFVTGGSDWHGWHDSDDLGLFAVRGHEIRAFVDVLDAAA